VELEQSRGLLEKNGVKIAAISYDSREILAAFAGKYAIGYPLLSDRGSEIIRRFGIFNLNMAPELRAYGVPHPVEYLVSPEGVVVTKYFVSNYQHRVTASAVALREFSEVSGDAPGVDLESGALRARIGLSSRRAFAGQEVGFFARFTLQPGWHTYGLPLPEGHTATSIEFDGPAVARQDVTWPQPEIVEFPLLNEALPVYSGLFEIRGRLLLKFPLLDGELILHGRLRFQQCGDSVCEPPRAISFELPLTLDPL
jgi:AhpC/TSA family/Disulphide bond corrector protein DsbC